MARFANALRLALENDGADDEEVIAATDSVEVDVAAADGDEVGDTEQEAIQVEEAADPIDGSCGSDCEDVAVIENTDAVIVDTSDSAEEAVSDANQAEAEVDAVEEQKEELEEAATGLESIYDMMVAAQQNGGLSRQAAQMATIAVESYTHRCGDAGPVMASLENFGGDSTRLRATSISLEQIGERIKQYWKVIWQFVINLKNKIWDFIKRVFSAAERLKQRGATLAKLQLSGAANKGTIEIKGYAKQIAVGTKVQVDPRQGLKDCLTLVQQTGQVGAAWGNYTRAFYDHIASVADGKAKAGDATFVNQLVLPKAFRLNPDNAEEVMTKVLPGNVQFKMERLTLNGGKIQLWKRITKIKLEANISEEAKIPVMTPDQVKAAGEEAVALHAAVALAQKTAATAAAQAKGLKAPTVSESISEADAKAAKELLSAFRSWEITQANLTAKVCANAVSTGLVYLKVAEMSAKMYGATGVHTSDKPVADKKAAA